MRVPMLPVPAPIALPVFLARSSSSYLPSSSLPNSILPDSANLDRNTTTTNIQEQELTVNEMGTRKGSGESIDGSRIGSDISKRTGSIFNRQQAQQQWLYDVAAVDGGSTAITRKGLNWTELMIATGEKEERAAESGRRAKVKSAKEKGYEERRDNRSGRRRRIPFEAYCITSPPKANTSQPSNQSRSVLVSRNPIANTTTSGSPSNVSISSNTALSPINITIGRMPEEPTTTTTISAQSVPAPAGFTFSSSSINSGGDGIHRHHHNSKLLHQKLLLLRSPPIEQQHHHQEKQSRSSRQTQHQRHQHHYHYRDVRLQSPQHLATPVLPLSSSSHNDGDDNDENGDYGDDDPGGITNFPTSSFHHARRKVSADMKGNKSNNKNNNHISSNKNKRNIIVQALNSNKPTNYHSSSTTLITGTTKKKRRHLPIPHYPTFHRHRL